MCVTEKRTGAPGRKKVKVIDPARSKNCRLTHEILSAKYRHPLEFDPSGLFFGKAMWPPNYYKHGKYHRRVIVVVFPLFCMTTCCSDQGTKCMPKLAALNDPDHLELGAARNAAVLSA